MTHDFSHLSDSQLTSQVYKRRVAINALSESLPQLYVQRKSEKATFRNAMNQFYGVGEEATPKETLTWHDVYIQAQWAALADQVLEEAREKLAELTELQTAQKRALKQRQSKRQEAKKAVIQSYLARQKRLAERGTRNPNDPKPETAGQLFKRIASKYGIKTA